MPYLQPLWCFDSFLYVQHFDGKELEQSLACKVFASNFDGLTSSPPFLVPTLTYQVLILWLLPFPGLFHPILPGNCKPQQDHLSCGFWHQDNVWPVCCYCDGVWEIAGSKEFAWIGYLWLQLHSCSSKSNGLSLCVLLLTANDPWADSVSNYHYKLVRVPAIPPLPQSLQARAQYLLQCSSSLPQWAYRQLIWTLFSD